MHGLGNGHGPVAQHVHVAGHLPNNLTVGKIRAGNSNIRNPILVSFVSKGLLPYHLGSGIKRALDKSHGVQTQAAAELGITKRMMQYKMQKYNL